MPDHLDLLLIEREITITAGFWLDDEDKQQISRTRALYLPVS